MYRCPLTVLTAFALACGAPAAEVVVIYTGPTDGILEDCGCNELAVGGIAARAAIIKQLRGKYPGALLVDVGDILPPHEGPQTELKGKYAAEIYSLLGYDAVNVGDGDCGYGPARVADFANRYGIPVLSSMFKNPSRYGAVPYIIVERGGVRVGIAGTFHPDLYDGEGELPVAEILAPEKAAAAILDSIKGETDVRILVAHAGTPGQCRLFAKKLSGRADVVISGGGYGLVHGGMDADGTHVAFSPLRGRYVGLLKISLEDDGKVASFEDELIPITLGAPRDDEVLSIMEEYYVNLRKLVKEESLLAAPETATPEGREYVGSSACRTCHAEIHEGWSATAHAGAYDELVGVGRWFDPECVRCHVTGYGYVGGFASAEETPDRAAVGCESCHGPGAGHPASSVALAPINEESCLICHTQQNSPAFSYYEYLERVMH